MLLGLYRGISHLLPPAARLLLARRLKRGREDAARLGERMGVPDRARPPGPLVWVHAASVGEALSALPLIERIRAGPHAPAVLVTTGTVTSAQIMAERLPTGAFHQYVPVDCAPWVARFLGHWRPDLALWVESELWPNLLTQTAARGTPTVLINGRLSDRSYRRWRRTRALAHGLLTSFDLVLAQSETYAERFRALGARQVETPGNLKFAAPPLPHDAAELDSLRKAAGDRLLWLAASTHPGEEKEVIAAHEIRAAGHDGGTAYPKLLTVIVPRHPHRGPEIAALAAARAHSTAQRSAGERIGPNTAIYIADTLGELGLFYRLAEVAFVGGSLIRHGGQNPIEPALLDCAILHGPHMENFAEITLALGHAGGAFEIEDGNALAWRLYSLLDSKQQRDVAAKAARRIAESERGVLDRVAGLLDPYLAALTDEKADAGA